MATQTRGGPNSPPETPIDAPRIALLTIGCKLNQAESEALARDLSRAGYRITDRAVPADAFVINTCAVTHVADRKSRHLIRLARRLSPDARILVTGCYARLTSEDILRRLGADGILPASDGAATLLFDNPPSCTGDVAEARLRTRAFVKIQEGCNDICAFCIVPRTRGRERSVPQDDILRSLQRLEAEGVREAVLTGTQLGAYGRDLDRDGGLVDLIATLLRKTAIPRLRVSSLQPSDITPDLLDLWPDDRLCRHFHIALQSGSDSVLQRMRRRYSTDDFRRAVDAIRERLPAAAITTDVLVGFPGESDDEFAQTERFCRETAFAAIHVFPFSPRPGTLAAKMPDRVAAPVKKDRVQRMLELARDAKQSFLARFLGETMTVLWEQKIDGRGSKTPLWEGLTDNYMRVLVESEIDLENRLLPARLIDVRDRALSGKLVDAGEALTPGVQWA